MKKAILALIVAVFAFTVTADAQLFTRGGQLSQSWHCALNGIAATLTQCQAVPADSKERNYITDISLQTTTATSGTYAIRTGTGTNCATGTAQLFPASGTGSDRFNAPVISQAMAHLHFITPLRPTAGHAICMIGVATDTISMQIHGFVRR